MSSTPTVYANTLQSVSLNSSAGFGDNPYTGTNASTNSWFQIESSQLPSTVPNFDVTNTGFTSAFVVSVASSATQSGTSTSYNLVYASITGTFTWVVQAMPAGSVGNIYAVIYLLPITSTDGYGSSSSPSFSTKPLNGIDTIVMLTSNGQTTFSPIFNIPTGNIYQGQNSAFNGASPWQFVIPLSNLFPTLSMINTTYQFSMTFIPSFTKIP